ncbi:MAG: hypothetical protein J6Y14_09815 [Fibrobacter sp.]|nr:hypothetical protein [Fibrobacter sp.]
MGIVTHSIAFQTFFAQVWNQNKESSSPVPSRALNKAVIIKFAAETDAVIGNGIKTALQVPLV